MCRNSKILGTENLLTLAWHRQKRDSRRAEPSFLTSPLTMLRGSWAMMEPSPISLCSHAPPSKAWTIQSTTRPLRSVDERIHATTLGYRHQGEHHSSRGALFSQPQCNTQSNQLNEACEETESASKRGCVAIFPSSLEPVFVMSSLCRRFTMSSWSYTVHEQTSKHFIECLIGFSAGPVLNQWGGAIFFVQ